MNTIDYDNLMVRTDIPGDKLLQPGYLNIEY